ncbi:hypothetical protein [Pandoraea pulmonicola]|uniref:Uncharacterized protein n=1 Tax=Pandoraea pulmonicola TaxID=93221 RepID=A0AAJ4ZD70_PANPU|nr:hypothetical protein [Pandoraea pulmonicola]SUA91230.1 Uncharacterised protein [Pandoraea pulmonicola]
MKRTIGYRGFEIHVGLDPVSPGMYEVSFRIIGPMWPSGVAAFGEWVLLQQGPYSRRWAYLIAEIAGRAAIDLILGPSE